MSKKHSSSIIPRYRGEEWTGTCLPRNSQHWLTGKQRSISKDSYHSAAYHKELGKVIGNEPWQWPKRHLYFISDMHGDADAFIASLVASGGIKKKGPRDKDIKLTSEGRKGRFLIGGDCFDKGPSTLRLLRVIKILIDKGRNSGTGFVEMGFIGNLTKFTDSKGQITVRYGEEM